MGILDGVIGTAQGLVGSVASLDPTGIVPGVTQSLGLSATPQVSALSPVGLGGGGTIGQLLNPVSQLTQVPFDLVGAVLGGGPGGVVDTTGFSGGNGRFATRTTVETMDTTTGQIVKMRRMPGSPKLMNSEVRAAKRVIKTVAKLHAKIPRRTVSESKMKKLTDAAIDEATRNVTGGSTRVIECK